MMATSITPAPRACPLALVLAGLGVAFVAWGLHVGALDLAPLSTVQAVLSGGLVFLAVLAERYHYELNYTPPNTESGRRLARR